MHEQVMNGKGINVPIDPLIFVSPSKRNHDDSHRGERFLRNMLVHHQDERKKTILHNHHYRVKIENVHQFGVTHGFFIPETLVSITELDTSLPTPTHVDPRFVGQLLMMFPNLRKINLTNILTVQSMGLLAEFCPRLETIIWNREGIGDFVSFDTEDLAFFRNLREITLDNRRFNRFYPRVNGNNNLIFQKCASNNPMLARVSMKHAIDNYNNSVAQSVLMQFVRSAPSLTYFRSDLTPENIAILQLERPAMVFE